ncbi:MAG: rRNA maturation RNase YbeY [Desulfovermiculus sp.]|nr:rRNA maturation RNase YbeY [Desulfovermiculus sp.]
MVRVQILPLVRPMFPFSGPELKSLVQTIVHSFGWKCEDIEVLVTSDLKIARMNRQYMQLPGPTNVLSFPLDMDHNIGLNGSIVLSAHALRREADLYAQDPAEHCLRLIVHAVLHLSGKEHGLEMESKTEFGMEVALKAIENGPPG